MSNLKIGMNGRFFENNWRPAQSEIAFAKQAGFTSMQFQGKETGLSESMLGGSFEAISEALKDAKITAVMEILIFIDMQGRTASGLTPIEVLKANLLAIKALPCSYVHWHLAPLNRVDGTNYETLECSLLEQFNDAVCIARQHAFRFALEPNERRVGLFSSPDVCKQTLDSVSGLGLVWDINHTSVEDFTAFKALIPSMTMLHVSDTPLPEVNYHWPLGKGNLDYAALCERLKRNGFEGPAILEIGGLLKSGGYGQDTNEALIQSLNYLRMKNEIN